MEELKSFTRLWHDASDSIVAHTSGSTGKPKEIHLLKADMLHSARATNDFFGLDRTSHAALPLAMSYIAGKMMAVRAIVGGYDLTMLPVSNNISLPDNGIVFDLVPVVPSQLPSLIAQPHYAGRIRNLLIGGAAPSAELLVRLADAGYKAFISYGMTEACSHVALADAADPQRIFHAMPGITFSTDDDMRLTIESSGMSFRRLQTNDVVELLGPQTFKWRGRSDGVINSGGIKLFPEELEALYAPLLPGINFYVVGRPDPQWGQCAVIVAEGDVDTDKILKILRDNIDHRRCPKAIECVGHLPRTANGKIIRR